MARDAALWRVMVPDEAGGAAAPGRSRRATSRDGYTGVCAQQASGAGLLPGASRHDGAARYRLQWCSGGRSTARVATAARKGNGRLISTVRGVVPENLWRSVSLVIPLYNEEAVLPALYERLVAVLAALDGDEALGCRVREIVFVNDGSRDGTLDRLRLLAEADPRVVALHLSRNFGHQAAITAGLDAARGDAIILMDGDLQDPPEVIPELLRSWREGNDVVVARRRSRQERGLRGAAFRLFHRLFGLVSDFPIEADAGIFGLLDRRAANELIRLQERNRFLPGLRSWVGFRQATVWYDRAARAAGEPQQSFGRLLRYAFDAVFSFSYKPLRLSWLFGFVVSTFAFIYGTILVIMRLLSINVVVGFTTPTVAILFLSGIQLITIGILGEYLGRIYDEIKRRPHYIVAERIEARAAGESSHGVAVAPAAGRLP